MMFGGVGASRRPIHEKMMESTRHGRVLACAARSAACFRDFDNTKLSAFRIEEA
jgi:hypothetical protein